MNYSNEETLCCYSHPRKKKHGICASCLREKLKTLSLQQKHFILSKIFSMGSSFLRRKIWHRKFRDFEQDIPVSLRHEDSFISIRFEQNGDRRWDKEHRYNISVSHESPRQTSSWQTSRNHLFCLIGRNKPNPTAKTEMRKLSTQTQGHLPSSYLFS